MRYTYSGSYWPDAEGTSWSVTVRCNRRLRGTSAGTSKEVTFSNESGLRALVERSIEELERIEE